MNLLILARAFVEAGWTKCATARGRRGAEVSPYENRAVQFCLSGAFQRAAYELGVGHTFAELMAGEILRSVVEGETGFRISLFNDHPETDQADVLALFDAACERVGKS